MHYRSSAKYCLFDLSKHGLCDFKIRKLKNLKGYFIFTDEYVELSQFLHKVILIPDISYFT